MFPGELRAFHAVAKTGSIRKAGELLNIAPSSVSRKVALLEHQIGTALIERTATGVVLTHAGTLVAEYARSVILDFDTLRADLNDFRGSRRRLIRLAAVESSIAGGLIPAIAAFREKFETVSFRLNMAPAPQVVEDVIRGDCDIGLTFDSPPHPDLVIVASIPEPIVLAVPNGHALAPAKSITLRELKGVTLALPELSFGVRRVFDRAIHDAGLGTSLNPAMSSNTFEALRDFVCCGAGVAVLPYRAVLRESTQRRLTAVPIEHETLGHTTIDIVTLRARRLPNIVSNFVQRLVRSFELG